MTDSMMLSCASLAVVIVGFVHLLLFGWISEIFKKAGKSVWSVLFVIYISLAGWDLAMEIIDVIIGVICITVVLMAIVLEISSRISYNRHIKRILEEYYKNGFRK